mgnify:CR=1 FL=1
MGILFEPGIEKGSEEKRIFRAWDDAEEFFSLSSWFKAEFASSLDFLCPLPSSGNNRVCKIQNKSINFTMIIPFTLLFGAIGYLYYKSKDEVSLVEEEKLDSASNQLDKDDLYKQSI